MRRADLHFRRFFLLMAFATAMTPCAAGTQCISGASSMQQAIANEAGRTTGISEFRFRAMTFTQAFEFIPTVPASSRTIVVDGGWNSGCTARTTGARTVIPAVTLRATYPNNVTSSTLTVSNLQMAAAPQLQFGQGAVRVEDNRIALTDGAVMAIEGTLVTFQRNQVFGGEVYIDAGEGAGQLIIANNEFRDVRRLRTQSRSTGAIEIRNNTILLRNSANMTLPLGFNSFDLYVYDDASHVVIANNLVGRSTSFDVWPDASTAVHLLLDADGNGHAPVVTLANNWIQSLGQGRTAGTDEFEAEWIDPQNHNVDLHGPLPFDAGASAAYLIPVTSWRGVNGGLATPGDATATDLRGRPRMVGQVDVGAHESDVLSIDGFE